jgi:hypothetical protein
VLRLRERPRHHRGEGEDVKTDFEVGQRVIRRGRYVQGRTRVERITKTAVICEDKSKWTLRGRAWGAGSSWSVERISVERPGEWEEIEETRRAERALNRVLSVSWRPLPIEAIYEVCAILDKYKKPEPAP